MSAKNERQSGAVDQVMFEKVIRDNLSPEGVAAVIAFLCDGPEFDLHGGSESLDSRRPTRC